MYYRPTYVNPRWYEMFIEQLDCRILPEDILDNICELACGIKIGASDECQRYAKHIHTHLIAAFKLGQEVGKNGQLLQRAPEDE